MGQDNIEEVLSELTTAIGLPDAQVTVVGQVIHIRYAYPDAVETIIRKVSDPLDLSGFEVVLENEDLSVTNRWTVTDSDMKKDK